MDIERTNSYASKGVGGTALGLAAGALGLNLLNGNLGGLFGGWSGDNMPVSRYEMAMQKDLTNKDMEIAYLRSREAAKEDSLEVYKYIDRKIERVERELCEQKVFNATAINNVSCLSGQVAQLMALTKLVVPNSSICPGWGEATVSVSTGTTTA